VSSSPPDCEVEASQGVIRPLLKSAIDVDANLP